MENYISNFSIFLQSMIRFKLIKNKVIKNKITFPMPAPEQKTHIINSMSILPVFLIFGLFLLFGTRIYYEVKKANFIEERCLPYLEKSQILCEYSKDSLGCKRVTEEYDYCMSFYSNNWFY